MTAVVLVDCGEFEAETLSGLYMPHQSVGADLALADEKMHLSCGAYSAEVGRFDKETADTQVAHARQLVAAVATPKHVNVLRDLDALGQSPRIRNCLLKRTTHCDLLGYKTPSGNGDAETLWHREAANIFVRMEKDNPQKAVEHLRRAG
jgi:hypothetical protein